MLTLHNQPNNTVLSCRRPQLRQIILLAQELVKNYHRDKRPTRCAVKVDLMKAYDSIHWDFVLQCLLAVGIPQSFVDWIKECITSPSFSIALNGNLVGFFKGGKGLKQGDPLSFTYLFLVWQLFPEFFIAKCKRLVFFKFHPQCKELQLTHLCFADDLLLFSKADVKSLETIQSALAEFHSLAGLCVQILLKVRG